MKITIDASPMEAAEIVYQLIAANAGLSVDSVRKQRGKDTVWVRLSGRPDTTGLTDHLVRQSEAMLALKAEVAGLKEEGVIHE